MYISNRSFPYPVLCKDTDDYIDSAFHVTYKSEEADINSIKICFAIELNNDALNDLVLSEQAEYAIHIECSSTAYRKIVKAKSNRIVVNLNINDIRDKVNFVAMIVAKQDLNQYSNPKLNLDYAGRTFNIQKSSLLAYENIDELRVTKNIEDFKHANSIFTVKCVPETDQSTAVVDLESHKIAILLPRTQYQIYTTGMRQNDIQPIVNSLVILPALIYALEATAYDGCDTYENKMWYQAICSTLKRHGKTLQREIEEKGSFVVAQELMLNPLSTALFGIKNMRTQGEEL